MTHLVIAITISDHQMIRALRYTVTFFIWCFQWFSPSNYSGKMKKFMFWTPNHLEKCHIVIYRRLPLPSTWVQNKNSLFDWQMIIFFYFCIGLAQINFFTPANSNIFPWYLLLFPCDHSFPAVKPNIFDPMRSTNMQDNRGQTGSTIKVKQGQGCGGGGKH
jgi:hypothetical protein